MAEEKSPDRIRQEEEFLRAYAECQRRASWAHDALVQAGVEMADEYVTIDGRDSTHGLYKPYWDGKRVMIDLDSDQFFYGHTMKIHLLEEYWLVTLAEVLNRWTTLRIMKCFLKVCISHNMKHFMDFPAGEHPIPDLESPPDEWQPKELPAPEPPAQQAKTLFVPEFPTCAKCLKPMVPGEAITPAVIKDDIGCGLHQCYEGAHTGHAPLTAVWKCPDCGHSFIPSTGDPQLPTDPHGPTTSPSKKEPTGFPR